MEQQSAGGAWAVPGSPAEADGGFAPVEQGGSVTAAPPGAGGPAGLQGPAAPGGRFQPQDSVPGTVGSAGPLSDAVPRAADATGNATAEIPQMGFHPMTVADILDGAFAIVKARPARILGITAVFVVPVHLVGAFLQRNVFGDFVDQIVSSDPAVQRGAANDGGGEFLGLVMLAIIPALALTFVAAALARLVGAWSAGHDLTAGELLKGVARKSWALLAAFVVVHLAEGVATLCFYIGLLFVMPLFAVTAPAIGAEDLGPIEGIKRAWNLAGRRYWPTLGVAWLIGITAFLLSNALGGLPQALAANAGTDADVAWMLLAAGNILGSVISTPFVAAATVLLYLDLRIRTEGLDIEMSARELLDDPS